MSPILIDKKYLQQIHDLLVTIIQLLTTISKEVLPNMQADLTTLKEQVAKTTTIEQSAVSLIQGIAQQLSDSKEDPEAIQGIIDSLNASATSLAAAVTANTPQQTDSSPSSETSPQ